MERSRLLIEEVSYQLTNFFTAEMVLLGALVLLALVFIARRPEVH